MNNVLFNTRVASKSRNYFFDIKQSQHGDHFLIISESIKQKEGFKRQQIMVFNTLLTDFAAAFTQCMQKLVELDPAINLQATNTRATKVETVQTELGDTTQSRSNKRFRELTDTEIEHEQMLNERNGKPKNAGLRWSDEDRQKVKKFYLQGEAISSIATSLARSNHSITAELKKQGLIVQDMQIQDKARPF
jgi:hypothetical protein